MRFKPQIQQGPYKPLECDRMQSYYKQELNAIYGERFYHPIQCPQPISGRTATNGGTSITINIRR